MAKRNKHPASRQEKIDYRCWWTLETRLIDYRCWWTLETRLSPFGPLDGPVWSVGLPRPGEAVQTRQQRSKKTDPSDPQLMPCIPIGDF